MLTKILVVIIAIPILEVLILIQLGSAVGFWPTVLVVLGTGFAGAVAARIVGFQTWISIQEELRNGRVPAEKLLDAFILFVAGIFLVLPGLLSDIVGLLLLFPGPRFVFKRWLRKKFDQSRRLPRDSSGIQYFIR